MKSLWVPHKLVLALSIFVFLSSVVQETKAEKDIQMDKNRIQIYSENPRYWQYKGEPILLIGGLGRGQSVSDFKSQSAS